MSDFEMNWVDEAAERSVSIDVSMNSTVDYGYMGLSVTADGVDDLPAAIKMIQAALDAAPAEFTASPDESVPMPPPVDFD